MIETYYDIITKIENFVDGLMIVDEKGIIKYNKQFSKGGFYIDEKASIGKTPMEVYPNLSEEGSTCINALKHGTVTNNKLQKLIHNGIELTVLDNTFPIYENGKIIGAVSTSKFVESNFADNFIDISNMTSSIRKDLYQPNDIIGNSEPIRDLKYKISKVAQTSSSVLIYGETGTGKELVAQSIHSISSRKNKPFISQNCAAIPETLLESIFFGTTKGIYTGAENKPGIFEMANGGTIFLDEINSMNLSLQAKLLKAIEEKKISRIGSGESKSIDVKIIAAVNEDPKICISKNQMRKDMYYRLSSLLIKVPPLRDRKEDIKELIEYFLNMYKNNLHIKIDQIDSEVIDIFNSYDWPGNIRELKNVLEGAINFCSGNRIAVKDLPDSLFDSLDEVNDNNVYINLPLDEALNALEIDMIIDRSKVSNNLSELAYKLNISKQSLNYKLKKHNLKMKI